MDDGPMDEAAQEELAAWQILWEVRTLLLSVPVARRRTIMENAIQEANAKHPGAEFMADVPMET